jgi:outer membrane protein assembly factor BamB
MMTDHENNDVPLPSSVGRRQFLRVSGLAALGMAGVTAIAGLPSCAPAPRRGRQVAAEVPTRRLGPGSIDFPTMSGAIVGGAILAGTRNLPQQLVAVYDLASSRVTRSFPVPNGVFAQAIAASGDREAYIGMHGARGETNLYHYELGSDGATGIAALDIGVRDIAVAPDGVVFIVGEPSYVYSYDPSSRELSLLPRPDPSAQSTFSVAATDATVFVGSGNFTAGGKIPRLTAIDRSTGEMHDILPRELSDTKLVFRLRIAGDKLLVGTYDLEAASFAAIDIDDYSRSRVVHLPGQNVVDAVARIGDTAYFTTRYSGSLWRFDLVSGEVTEEPGPQPSVPHWNLASYGDKLAAVSVNSIWVHDPVSREGEIVSLLEAGAPGSPQQMQSLAAGAGRVMVASNWRVGVRDIATGEYSDFIVPGEAKAMLFVDDLLYLAMYTVGEIWTYDPVTQKAQRAASMPREQNRPTAIFHDPSVDRILVSTSSDFTGGGALVVFARASGEIRAYENPFGPDENVRTVAAVDGVAVIAGSRGGFAAFDLAAGTRLWDLDHFRADHVASLTAHAGSVYGITLGGTIFTLTTGGRIRREHARAGGRASVRLCARPGVGLFGASTSELFSIDPISCEARVLVDGLSTLTFNGPHLSIDENGDVYVLAGVDVLQVSPR